MPDSQRKALVWGAALLAASLVYPTWRYGVPFLRQFFISPFQFFSAPLWLFAYFCHRTGVMPMRSGPTLRREADPKAFRENLWGTILLGAGGFLLNLVVSWAVLYRETVLYR